LNATLEVLPVRCFGAFSSALSGLVKASTTSFMTAAMPSSISDLTVDSHATDSPTILIPGIPLLDAAD